jgi:transposase
MARRRDPKEAALAESRCLNPHPEQVTDPEFLSSDFFDARDTVQVKYEMVRKVEAGGAPVTEAAAAFGYSRPAYYAAAAALESAGIEGLLPARPGPRGAHKLTDEICAWAEQRLAADPALRPSKLAGPVEEEFGVRAHPRSIERALARYRERHSKSRGTTRPRDAEDIPGA